MARFAADYPPGFIDWFREHSGTLAIVSRSDNTEWHWEAAPNWRFWPFRRGQGRGLRREWQKRQRQRERAALRNAEQPEPARTRGSVKYDYW